MEKVLRKVNENGMIILFVVTILAMTFYMGMSERKLAMASSIDSTVTSQAM